MNDQLVAFAIQETPNLIAQFKALFMSANPGVPEPTDEEIIAAQQAALTSSLAKDAAWLAAHPETVV